MADCIFCKIIKGEIPSSKVYEDNHVFAFLDINPINPGHTLIVPKRHSEDFYGMTEEEIKQAFTTAKKVAKGVVAGVSAEGFNIGMNNGAVAGQAVMHAHVHIIPRFPNDGHHHWKGKSYAEGQKEEVCRRIREALK